MWKRDKINFGLKIADPAVKIIEKCKELLTGFGSKVILVGQFEAKNAINVVEQCPGASPSKACDYRVSSPSCK